MTRTPIAPSTPRRRRSRGRGKGGEPGDVERRLAALLSRLAAQLVRPTPSALAVLLDRALDEAQRIARGAADAADGGTRWTALFNRLLAAVGDALGAALVRHPETRVSDENAAASVVVHSIERLVRRSAELPNARARAAARAEARRILEVFLRAQ